MNFRIEIARYWQAIDVGLAELTGERKMDPTPSPSTLPRDEVPSLCRVHVQRA